jgi:excisionase family DNA binding protein
MTKPIPTADRTWLSLAEAREHTGLSIKTLRKRIAEGSLPAYRVGPRVLRVRRVDVDSLFRRVPSASGA